MLNDLLNLDDSYSGKKSVKSDNSGKLNFDKSDSDSSSGDITLNSFNSAKDKSQFAKKKGVCNVTGLVTESKQNKASREEQEYQQKKNEILKKEREQAKKTHKTNKVSDEGKNKKNQERRDHEIKSSSESEEDPDDSNDGGSRIGG